MLQLFLGTVLFDLQHLVFRLYCLGTILGWVVIAGVLLLCCSSSLGAIYLVADVADCVPTEFPFPPWSGRLVLLPVSCSFAMMIGAVTLQAKVLKYFLLGAEVNLPPVVYLQYSELPADVMH
ncbi:hypothetical protein Nepgr_013459 [Nepenthes gracilis]|uniref:Uncharacterized protein n=1 Tax=Nepenthes gracilis TaxID=150966 RepID=A0AAD3SHW2_NEPGR|nr:hypothetical protein Nepgr_013459 [Nepenthes gracilis]